MSNSEYREPQPTCTHDTCCCECCGPDCGCDCANQVSEQRTTTKIQVIETTTTVYDFPNYPEAKCSAHGDPLCTSCARNPSTCANGEMAGCGTYATTGMHWDTCPNRIR